MKKVTAIEWYDTELKEIDFKLQSGLINFDQCKMLLSEALEQAIHMEKEQIIECCVQTTKDCWVALMKEFGEELNFCEEDLTTINEEAEQYYNETFNK